MNFGQMFTPAWCALSFLLVWLYFYGWRAVANFAFTFDETFTFLVAQRPDAVQVVRALLDGMDNNAPLHYLIAHCSIQILGANELGLRFPFLAAMAVNIGGVAWFAFRHGGTSACLWSTAAYCVSGLVAFFSMEARMYTLLSMLVLGCVCCWQWAVSERTARRRRGWLALGGCLGLAVLVHYYGLLLCLPCAVAYVALCWKQRRILGIPLWAAAGLAPAIILMLPFAVGARQYSAAFWTALPKTPLGPAWHLLQIFEPLYFVLGLLVFLHTIAELFPERETPTESTLGWHWTTQVLLLGFLCAPFYHWAVAVTVTKAYTFRYFLYATIPGALLFGRLVSRLPALEKISWIGQWAAVLGVVILAHYIDRHSILTKQAVVAPIAEWRQFAEREPGIFTTGDYHVFLRYWIYAPEALKHRLVLTVDPARALAIAGANTDELALSRLAPFTPIRRLSYEELKATTEPVFWLNGTKEDPRAWQAHWLEKSLSADGFGSETCPSCGPGKAVLYRLRGPLR